MATVTSDRIARITVFAHAEALVDRLDNLLNRTSHLADTLCGNRPRADTSKPEAPLPSLFERLHEQVSHGHAAITLIEEELARIEEHLP